ncbi:unnamed protein product [Caenorhabditis sp. 36 PRJEB53466]|nr:unnamed protein product [Caenorhabditis sp. 36 PRJEB53466]
MIASVAVLFVYRHQVIVGTEHPMHMKTRNLVLILTFNYILYMNMTVPALNTLPADQVAVKIEILKVERCPPKNLPSPDVFIMQTSFDLLPWLLFLIVFVGTECGCLALHSSWILFFSTLSSNFSRKTRILQIKFLGALVLQIAIPTTLCYCPILYCVITTLTDHYWQFANDICVFVFSTHGTISSVCLVLLYDCYRDFLFHCIRKLAFCCKNRGQVQITENASVIRSDISRNAIHASYIT